MILVQTRKSEQHSRNRDLINRRQRLPCWAVPSVHPLHLGKNKIWHLRPRYTGRGYTT
jgi:hypothetical protein